MLIMPQIQVIKEVTNMKKRYENQIARFFATSMVAHYQPTTMNLELHILVADH